MPDLDLFWYVLIKDSFECLQLGTPCSSVNRAFKNSADRFITQWVKALATDWSGE